jgi:hypothetical protein
MKAKITRTVTPKKRQANQRNSLKSTGPTTNEGKEQSRWNALKHGLLAKEAIIPTGAARESGEGHKEILSSLILEYRPRGVIEHILVERISQAYWRLRRAQRAEIGEIQKSSKGISHADRDRERDFWDSLKERLEDPEQRKKISISDFRFSDVGLKQIVLRLEQGLKEIEGEGRISEGARDQFSIVLNGSSILKDISPDLTKRRQAQGLKNALKTFQQELEHYKAFEKGQAEARMSSNLVPEETSGANLLRYETAIERQMYKAIRELQRLQEIRFQSTKRINSIKRIKTK